MEELLKKLNACKEAKEWAKGKNWEEVYSTCHRGDWLLWLFAKTNPDELRLLTLAKGHCAKTVIHLMTDERSRNAVEMAIKFGEGKCEREELNAAAASAASAAYASAAYAYVYASAAAASAADAAYAAASAADADASAAYASAAASAAADASDASAADAAAAAAYAASAASAAADAASEKIKIQNETADICRKFLPIEIWNINK